MSIQPDAAPTIEDLLLRAIVNEVDSLNDPFFDEMGRLRDELRIYYLSAQVIQNKIWMHLRQDANEPVLHTLLRISQGFAFLIQENGMSQKLESCIDAYMNPCGHNTAGIDYLDKDFAEKLSDLRAAPMWLTVIILTGAFYKGLLFRIKEVYPYANTSEAGGTE